MKHLVYVLLLVTISSCLKRDALELESGSNFLQSQFYLQEFESYNIEITKITYRSRIINDDTTFAPTISFRVDSSYINKLEEAWGGEAKIDILIPSTNPFRDDRLDTSIAINYNQSSFVCESNRHWERDDTVSYLFPLKLINRLGLMPAEDLETKIFYITP